MRRQRNPNDDPNDIEDFIFKMEGWPIQSDNMRQWNDDFLHVTVNDPKWSRQKQRDETIGT